MWSDVVCPWCYLGRTHLRQALDSLDFRDDVRVTYRSFELDPGAPTGLTTATDDLLAAKYGMTPEQARQAQQRMEQRAAAEGLTFRMGRLRSGNTRAAHRLLHLARESGRQEEVAEALHRAYFTDQRDVYAPESLSAIATEAGLAAGEVREVLAGDRYEDAVEADERLARELGATGVPFFVVDRRFGVSGAQPAPVLADVLRRARGRIVA